jgi:hypothetical protein
MKTNAFDIPEMDDPEASGEFGDELDISESAAPVGEELPERATRPLMQVPVDLAGTVNSLTQQIELVTRTLQILE